MIVIEPKVKFTKADVECIEKLDYLCKVFDFSPWEVFECVKDRCGLNNVEFEYEVEEDEKRN